MTESQKQSIFFFEKVEIDLEFKHKRELKTQNREHENSFRFKI